VTLSLCSAKYVLEFRNVLGGSGGNWGFSATKEGSGQVLPDGQLNDKSQQVDAMLPDSQVPAGALGDTDVSFVSEVAGSGPWEWAGQGPFVFLRGGKLKTPWGDGRWGLQRSSGDGIEHAAAGSVFVDFVGAQHEVHWSERECLRLQSRRKTDGEKVGVDFAGGMEPATTRCAMDMGRFLG